MSFPQATAHILLETECVLFRPEDPFRLTSGRYSPVYIDTRRVISYPRARAALMDMAVDLLARDVGYEAFDVIAGGETAGIPFAAWIAERLSLPMVYVRKQAKAVGRLRQIEGVMDQGARALLVEDLCTDGKSKLAFIDALREAGANIEQCFVVFNYGIFQNDLDTLRDQGVRLHWLASWDDIVTEAQRCGFFDDGTIEQVRKYLAAPEQWSDAEGAKRGDPPG
jgi:orotate phosphoribosyltransferase